jgi:type II secretory pathway component PulF
MSADPPAVRKPSAVATGLLIAALVGLWLLLWGQFLIAVPRTKKTYDEFGMALPASTRAVFEFGLWAAQNAILVLPTVLVGAVVLAVLFGALRPRPRWTALVTILAVLLLALLTTANVVVAGALALPWFKLQEGLAK